MGFVSASDIRKRFSQAMSNMYGREVPLYQELIDIAKDINRDVLSRSGQLEDLDAVTEERHGAIRVGTAQELQGIADMFEVMGMLPVNYYDLSVADLPVHSTAFRPIDKQGLKESPFRMFVSLLRMEMVFEEYREQVQTLLEERNIFSDECHRLVALNKEQGGLNKEQSVVFIEQVLNIFKWHGQANVSKEVYETLLAQNSLIADIACFKGPHINHLTPAVLDIDRLHQALNERGIATIDAIQGPPVRNVDILLRQTSFKAMGENVMFSDGQEGKHMARFGEIEQRGIALTPKGMALYDKFLSLATEKSSDLEGYKQEYPALLKAIFSDFPDTVEVLMEEGLVYHNAQRDGVKYEDFLPVSAAGIFKSNLDDKSGKSERFYNRGDSASKQAFEKALGRHVIDSHALYSEV